MRSRGIGAAVVIAGLAVGLLNAEEVVTAKKPAPVRIGMIQTLFRGVEPNAMLALTEPFGNLMNSQTGIPGQFCIIPDAETMARQIHEGELQLGIIHGIEFAWVKERYPDLQPLLLAYNQTIKLKGFLLVRDDCDCKCIADLRGKSLSFPRRSLNHCYLFLHKTIHDAGLEPAGFFAATPTPANTELALDYVVDGTVAATVVDGVSLDVYRSRKPGRAARLRVLQESCLFPTATIIYKPDMVDPAMVKKFHDGMATAHTRVLGRQMLTLWRLSNFGPVPAEYPQLLADIVKIYPTTTHPAVFIAEPKELIGESTKP